MAAPAFRAASYAEDADGVSPWSASPTVPTGTAENDILLALLEAGGPNCVFTGPSGWAAVSGSYVNGAQATTEVWWKRAGASESGSYTFGRSSGGGGTYAAAVVCYSGCITTGDPFEDVTSAGDNATSSNTPTTATITTSGDDRTVVALLGVEDNWTFSSGYPPTDWNDRVAQTFANGTDCAIYIMDRSASAAGDVSAVNFGTLAANDFWASTTLALIPAASTTTHNPEVSVTASSTATFDVSLTKQPAVSATGASSATFSLALTKFPAVNATGSSTATFDVSKVVDTEASVTGSSTATFALSRTAGTATTIAGLSTADFDLDLNLFPSVAATGSSTATFDVTREALVDPEMASAGAATAVFGLTVDHGCELSVAGNASCQFDVTGGEDADQTSLLPLIGAGT